MKLARKRKTEPLTNVIDKFYNTYHKSSGKKEPSEILSPIKPESVTVVPETPSYRTERQTDLSSDRYRSAPSMKPEGEAFSQQKLSPNYKQISKAEQLPAAASLKEVSKASQRPNIFSNLPQDVEEYQNLEDDSQFLESKYTRSFNVSSKIGISASEEKQPNLFEQISSALEETDVEPNNKEPNSLDYFTEPPNIAEDESSTAVDSSKSLDSHILTSDINTLSKRIEFLVKEVDQLKSENKNTTSPTKVQETLGAIPPESNESTIPIPKSTSHIKESYEALKKSTSRTSLESQSVENKDVITSDIKNIEQIEIDESPLVNLKAKITNIMDNVNATSRGTIRVKDDTKNKTSSTNPISNTNAEHGVSQEKHTQKSATSVTSTQNAPSTTSLKAMKLDIQTDKNIFTKDKIDSVLSLLNEEETNKTYLDSTKQLSSKTKPKTKTQVSTQYSNLPKHIKITRKYRLELEKGALNVQLELTNKDTNEIAGNYKIESLMPEGWNRYSSSLVFENALNPSTSQVKLISVPFLGSISSWYLYSGKY